MLRMVITKITGLVMVGIGAASISLSAQTNTPSVTAAIPLFEATARLMNALQYDGSLQDIQRFVEQGADVNAKKSEGWHALQLAAKRGDIEIVRYLLDKGAEINAENNGGVTALGSAAFRGYTDIVNLLLERGADVNAGSRDEDGTALSCAVAGDHTNLVAILLDKGADINSTNNSGCSVLLTAIDTGRRNSAKYLIARGANVNLEDNVGRTAVGWAETQHDLEMVKLLQDAGATASSSTKQMAQLTEGLDNVREAQSDFSNSLKHYFPDAMPASTDNPITPAFVAEGNVDADGYVTNLQLLKPFTVTNSAGAVFTDAVLVKLMPAKFMYKTSSGAMGTQRLELLPAEILQKIGYNAAAALAANQAETQKKASEQERSRQRWAMSAQQNQRPVSAGATATVVLSIKERAAKNWPGDYQMQQYEVEKQTDAYNWLAATSFISGLPSDVLEQIKTDAANNWPGDYVMQKYEIEKQAKAYVALH